MKFTFESRDLEKIKHRCLAVLATKDGKTVNATPAIDALLQPFVASGEFGKGFGGNVYLVNPETSLVERLFFINVGEKIGNPNDVRKATAKAWKILRSKGITDVLFSLNGFASDQARAAVEGWVLANYHYGECKSEKDKLPERLGTMTLHSTTDCEADVRRWEAICRGTCRARDLSQMPPNILHPEKMAEMVTAWGASQGFQVTVMDEQTIKEQGMGAMYSVGQGSARESKFIIMEYTPKKPSGKTVALVGKAVTFDSGGISLKPGAGMSEMKGDMGGGAAVIGAMTVLAETNCPHRVIGLVPAVENMPSSSATRPSDVVKTLSGLTVEINNTDAEGRLILADALTYADRYKPDYVVDFATLTGACLVALGPKVCGVMGNDQPLVDAILESGKELHELFWQLPLVEEYKEYLKSQTADISNISSVRWGGTITAGLFLERFASKYRWAHCDIAAAIFEKGDEYSPAGGTGIGVRTAIGMLERL